MADNAERRCIWFKRGDTFDIEDDVEKRYKGMEMRPRTVENALRRGELKFYQIGLRRYTTPELIDEWLESCVTTGGARAK